MAIVIPSSKTYDRQNPKVRDNVIERIEVGAVEVLPDNEYETPVYNETLPLNGDFSYSNSGGDTQTSFNSSDAFPVVACGTIIYDKYVKAIIKIKKTANNKYITKIYNQNREGSNTPYTQISKNFEEKSYYYQVNDSYSYIDVLNSSFDFEKIKSYSSQKENLSNKTISGLRDLIVRFSANDENGDDYDNRFVTNWGTPTITAEGTNDIVSVINANIYGGSLSTNSITNFSTSETNLSKLDIDDSDNEYITITIPKIFIGRTIYAVSTGIYTYAQASHSNLYPSKVLEIQQNVVRAEITIYGNTIGIDLTDKTIYIPDTDKTSKKVHSVYGNELMQTSNYNNTITYENKITVELGGELSSYDGYSQYELYTTNDLSVGQKLYYNGEEAEVRELQGDGLDYYTILVLQKGEWAKQSNKTIEIFLTKNTEINSIVKMYAKTKSDYANGKETATIRCSIGDYYEYNETSEKFKGEKSISITNRLVYLDNSIVSIDFLYIPILYNRVEFILDKKYKFPITINFSVLVNGILNNKKVVIKENEITNYVSFGISDKVAQDSVSIISVFQTLPMSFKMYDQVIPMVYGSDGQDRPMSTYQDGSPKVFQVLGTNIFYDGAVWQELSLQEV